MKIHEKLDKVLIYMSKELGEIPKRPESITEKANLKLEKAESYLILGMLCSDGYVYSHDERAIYGILYKGVVFINDGGYTKENKKHKLKLKTELISNYSDLFLKPAAIVAAILIVILNSIRIYEFLF